MNRLAKRCGVEVEDEQKDFDRIGVWPADDDHRADEYDGDHYVFSWVEAEKRVKHYAEVA